MKKLIFFIAIACATVGQAQDLHKLQQEFVNLRFGMFIHYNIPTYMSEDWADPGALPVIFAPDGLDCVQWSDAAKSANMTYGCLTTKHHSGFCIWDTKTTDYNVMNSAAPVDVVRKFASAFRDRGLKVMFYYSILDTHHRLRPHLITRQHVQLVKDQLTELLTNYGEVTAIIIDGWDAPWSRISYDEIPFSDIYHLVKSIQPNCLLLDLNAAKYPAEALFYTDIKSYEQGAGQHIEQSTNTLPALSCLPINKNWFWKEHFPTTPVKDPSMLVSDILVPLNNAYCNLILNVAPNRHGLIDQNALDALSEIGKLWKHSGSMTELKPCDKPITAANIAKHQPVESSWSYDSEIMDFVNDDNFRTSWVSNELVEKPWITVELQREQPFNMITIAEGGRASGVSGYTIEYLENNTWKKLSTVGGGGRVKVERFPVVWGNKVRVTFEQFTKPLSISEIGIYLER
jgi:alpha-L-fucosidase